MRFFKNNLFGDDKLNKSFEIYMNKDYNTILEEVHEGILNNVKEINEKILQSISISTAVEEKKTVVIYFYDTDEVDIHF